MPQLDPSTFGSQLFWLAICFVTLYLVMALVVIPRITGTMGARADHLDGDLAEAEALRNKAEAALKAYEEALAEARTKALGLAQEMRAEVQAETDLSSTQVELEQLANFKADLHKSCDFVLKNFEIRQEARDEEIEALRQAKAILSGADFNAALTQMMQIK